MKAKETDEKIAQRLEEIIADFKETGVIPPLSRRLTRPTYSEDHYGYGSYNSPQIGATFSRTFGTSSEAKIGERSAVDLFKKNYIHENIYGELRHSYYVVAPSYRGSSMIRVDFFAPEFWTYKSARWEDQHDAPAKYRQYVIVIVLLSRERIAKCDPNSYYGTRFMKLKERYNAIKTEDKLKAVAMKSIAEAIADKPPKATARTTRIIKI